MLNNLREKLSFILLPERVKKDYLSPFRVASTRSADVPVYSDMSIRKATREGYKISVYVYRSVRTIIQAASAIPWIIEDENGELIPNHPLAKVLKNPNPVFSGQDMMELLIGHLLLGGNALWMPIIVNGQVKEFWPVMPDLVSPIPSDVPGEWLKGWQVHGLSGMQKILPPDQFIHFMQMDPGNLYWGTSPLMAAARTVDTDNEAQDTQKISMQNRGVTDGVFTHETPFTPEQFEEARRQIRENFLAKSRRREPWVLGAGAKWNQMSLTPIEMDYIQSRLANLRGIATAFGLDPWVLGDRSASTYNNVMEVRKAVYIDVALPILDDVKSTLNLKIAPLYGNITISYDTSKVAALREDHKAKAETGKMYFDMGVPFNQINERLEMGFEEFPGWDQGYLPVMLLPTGSPKPTEEDSEDTEIEEKSLTEDAKTAHWKRVDRRRVAYWGIVSKKVLPLYDNESKAIAKAIKGKAPSDLVDAAIGAIDSGKQDWEKMITAVMSALIADFGGVIADDLGGTPKGFATSETKWEFDPTSEAIRRWIAVNGAKSIKTILATNLEDVKGVILAGIDENLTTPQIARNLRKFYTDRSPFKSMRVARTETSHAAGYGQQSAARQSGVVKTKMWVSSRDDRVRDSHVALDGETVNFDKPYSDGSTYPGEQDVMCRCVEAYGTR